MSTGDHLTGSTEDRPLESIATNAAQSAQAEQRYFMGPSVKHKVIFGPLDDAKTEVILLDEFHLKKFGNAVIEKWSDSPER